MKIRKTVALLTALAMIAALAPAMALTAYADEPSDYLIMADGETVYKIASENLLADGSFESDAWAEQLTVGKSYGSAGKEYISPMSENIGGNRPVWARARLMAGAKDGLYAVRLVNDKSTTGNGINDANKPASIKHYIKNESGSSKMYYVRFYAKSGSGASSLSFSLSAVDDKADGASGRNVTLNDRTWTQIDGMVNVKSGENMLLNIYALSAGTYLDGFDIFEVYKDAECSAFTNCLKKWGFGTLHPNGEVINKDILLPTSTGDAKVEWVSSRPDVIRVSTKKGEKPTGIYTAPDEDTEVVLTATISYGIFSVQREYRLIAKGIADDVRAQLLAAVPYGIDRSVRLPATLSDYPGSAVRWVSSAPDIVSNTGSYKDPGYQVPLTLTATFTWGDATIVYTVEAVAGITPSLITNGSFDLVRGLDDGTQEIFGWTTGVPGADRRNGGTQPMTTATFDIAEEQVVDENGESHTNKYLVSKGHGSLDSANSIRRYVELTPGKHYRFSYKSRYMGDGTSEEYYVGAYLVGSSGSEIVLEHTNTFTSEFGELYYKDGEQWKAETPVTAADGWKTYETMLSPQAYNKYLLIAAKWLNRDKSAGSNNTDGRWAFDDFVLEEVDAGYTADVTVQYYPYGEDEFAIKEDRIQADVYGDTIYTATAADKADIKIGNTTYRYDSSVSTDSIRVTKDGENVIRLYFRPLELADFTINYEFYDKSGERVDATKNPVTVRGYKYFPNSIPDSALCDEIGFFTVDGKHYTCDEPDVKFTPGDDAAQNQITLKFKEINNLISNGFFEDGLNGWTDRKVTPGQPQGDISMDPVLGVNALTISTRGRNENAIGTVWTVTKGKRYHLSFCVGGAKPEESNYKYNVVSDARKHFEDNSNNAYDAAGNNIIEYGRNMTNGEWKRMEADFVAQTDMVYFCCGWSAGPMKFAAFILTEYDDSVKYDFTTSVTIKYLDRATGAELKPATTVNGLGGFNNGSASYTAEAGYRSDIRYNGKTYTYDNTSKPTVTLRPEDNVINLYFTEVVPVSVDDIVIDLEAGTQTYTLPAQVSVRYNNGSTQSAAATWDEAPELKSGDVVEIMGTAAGLPVKATVRKFYQGEARLPDDYDQYQWIGSGTRRYAVEKDKSNIIPNPQFLEDVNGWTNRCPDGQSTEITGANFSTENGIDGRVMTITTRGRSASNSIGTVWKVETGKTYYLAFRVGGGKPDASNEKWNVVSDARTTVTENNATGWDATGTMLVTYGHDMTANKWSLMEKVFTAQTDTVFFESGWVDNIKLADFKLYELVDGGNKYFDSESSPLAAKIDVVVNDDVADTIYVDKDGAVPNLSSQYPECTIDYSNVDTSVPNAGTIYVVDPGSATTIDVNYDRVVLSAVGGNVEGVVVITQFDGEGRELSVETHDVSVEAGGHGEVAFSPASGVKLVRAMLLESRGSLRPILRSTAYNNY